MKYIPIYKSYIDAVAKLNPEDRLIIYEAIFEYGFTGKEPEFDNPYLEMGWELVKPNLDNNIKNLNKNIENGKKGGRPKKKSKIEPKVESKSDSVTTPQPEVVEEAQTKVEDNSDDDSHVTDDVTSDNTNVEYAEMCTLMNGVEVGVRAEYIEIWHQIKERRGTMRRMKKNTGQFSFDMQLKEEIENIKNNEEFINNYTND